MKNFKKFEDYDNEDFKIDRKQKLKDKQRKRAKKEKNIMRSKNLNASEIMNFYDNFEEWS